MNGCIRDQLEIKEEKIGVKALNSNPKKSNKLYNFLKKKKLNNKKYYRHTGHPGGINVTSPSILFKKKPEDILKLAVKRMLPSGPLSKKQLTKLKIYKGNTHPHEMQNPKVVEFSKLSKKKL